MLFEASKTFFTCPSPHPTQPSCFPSPFQQYEEHTKRAWSVDFSLPDPSRLASGSDDGTVRLWSIHQEASVATMTAGHNVCSVQFSPDQAHLLAAGSVNHKVRWACLLGG